MTGRQGQADRGRQAAAGRQLRAGRGRQAMAGRQRQAGKGKQAAVVFPLRGAPPRVY